MSFNPRAPCGARHTEVYLIHDNITCFNPRAPCGARLSIRFLLNPLMSFNPRAPCGARPDVVAQTGMREEFQSTRPVWGATEFRIVGVVL